MAEWSSALAYRISFGRLSVQIPAMAKIAIVISCAPWQGCLNPVSHKVFLRYLPVYGGTTSATIRCCNEASPEGFARNISSLKGVIKKNEEIAEPGQFGISLRLCQDISRSEPGYLPVRAGTFPGQCRDIYWSVPEPYNVLSGAVELKNTMGVLAHFSVAAEGWHC